MSTIPSIPPNAPFDTQQRAWLNGWLAGLFSDAGAASAPGPTQPVVELKPLLIMYGSQSGSAEGLAKGMGKQATGKGFEPRVMELNDHIKVDLTKEENLVIITSTWGEGDPPDNALEFWNFIKADSAPKLANLRYSVLALGDTSYSEFCGAGKIFDDRLAALGAKRFLDRIDCDVDYEEPAETWTNTMWEKLGELVGSEPSTPAPADKSTKATSPKGHGRKNPFPAKLLTNRLLNNEGSAKDTRHFEISLDGSGLEYEVGDALGVVPQNCGNLVDEIIHALGVSPDAIVPLPDSGEATLKTALTTNYAITQPAHKLVATVADRTGDPELAELLQKENKAKLNDWLWGREVIDLLLSFPAAKFEPAEFVEFLRKLQPRLYSISSSPKAHPGEVHLTVAAVRYESFDRSREGVCSTFLADRVDLNATEVPVFVQVSHGFRVPENGDTPMIMVGPGTGIAPFRAFLEERRATEAKGKNWLFFGDQKQNFDFLYREELEAFHEDGFLTRLDLAFSRDQEEKIYVQNRIEEHAAELWLWLEAGAHFYVCGDAKRMAKDVDSALHRVIATQGDKTEEEAREYVKQMKADKRYQRDVY
jgi:sulfite reductase (NADPH) flavoprotein alpha-component